MASAAVATAALAATSARASSAVLADRAKGILYGASIGDALAAPAHWYYEGRAGIIRDYGEIRDFVKPKFEHPGSIMGLSNTGGAGRGGQSSRLIGDVILHGKRDYWRRGVHYHCTLEAGENTLNQQVARLLVRRAVKDSGYSPEGFLDSYVTFMTTPDSHNDAYAESYHRMFFSNYASGVPPEKCAGDDGHNIASMGGFVTLPPVALLAAVQVPPQEGGEIDIEAAADAAGKACAKHVLLTHASDKLSGYADAYGRLLARVFLGVPLKDALVEAGRSMGVDVARMASRRAAPHGTACYIEDSFPWLLFLAYKYGDDFEEAMVQNVHVGGENVHRGAALGAILGAAVGSSGIPVRWRTGLHEAKETAEEAEGLARLVAASPLGSALSDA